MAGGNHRLVYQHISAVRGDADVRRTRLAARQVDAGARQRGRARRQVLAARLQDAVGVDGEVTHRAQAAVGLDTGAQQATAADFTSGNLGMVDGGDRPRVVQRAAHRQLLVAARIQQAGIAQVCAEARRQVRTGAHRALLVQQGRCFQADLVRLQDAARVVEMPATHLQIGGGGNHAIRIRQRSLAGDIRRSSRGDAALAVVQHSRLQGQRPRARMLDLAVCIGNREGIDVQVLAVDGDAPRCIVQIAGDDARITRARLQDTALGVVQIARLQIQLAGLQAAFRVVQGAAGRHMQRARRYHHRLVLLTSPCVAVRPRWAALVWLPPMSSVAPVSSALPAARVCPCAASVCVVLTVKSPDVPSLPSACMPAAIRLLALLSMVFAVMLLLPCAAITPVLTIAPLAFKVWLPAAYRLPVLFNVSSVVLRLAPANTLPAALFKFATFRVALPATACNWPWVLSISPPDSVSVCPAATVPCVLSRLSTFTVASCAATMRPVLFSKVAAFTSASPLPSTWPPVLSNWPVAATVIRPVPVCARLPLRLSRLPALTLSCLAMVVALR